MKQTHSYFTVKKTAVYGTFFLLFFIFFSSIIYAQSNFEKVDEWLGENVSKMGGRALLVIYKDGKLLYNHAENKMNNRQKMVGRVIAKRQGKEANTVDFTSATRQQIASSSKWLSAALVMTFVDEGKLKLTDTAGKYLPVLSQHGKGNITIGQCLSHLTGIKTPSLRQSIHEMTDVGTMDEAIEKIAMLPMEGKPGAVFHYSNAGLQIAGAIIEKISGKSFETLFSERIAQPLEMKNTDFGKGKVALPAGGASSTADDYLHFLIMILNKGVFNGKRILREESIKVMQVNRITKEVTIGYSPPEAGNFGYGYGEWIMKNTKDNLTTASVSSPGAFGSFPWVNNTKNYSAFLMAFYLKSEGRHERYTSLMQLVDDVVQ